MKEHECEATSNELSGTTWEFTPDKLFSNDEDASYMLNLTLTKNINSEKQVLAEESEATFYIWQNPMPSGALYPLIEGSDIYTKYIDPEATSYTLTIHGGADATNEKLIAWLEANVT